MSTSAHVPYVLLKEAEAAQWLALEVTTLRRWRTVGLGPRFIRLSAVAVRYHPDDLTAFIEAGRRSSTREPCAATEL
jgi:hypothetical protein